MNQKRKVSKNQSFDNSFLDRLQLPQNITPLIPRRTNENFKVKLLPQNSQKEENKVKDLLNLDTQHKFLEIVQQVVKQAAELQPVKQMLTPNVPARKTIDVSNKLAAQNIVDNSRPHEVDAPNKIVQFGSPLNQQQIFLQSNFRGLPDINVKIKQRNEHRISIQSLPFQSAHNQKNSNLPQIQEFQVIKHNSLRSTPHDVSSMLNNRQESFGNTVIDRQNMNGIFKGIIRNSNGPLQDLIIKQSTQNLLKYATDHPIVKQHKPKKIRSKNLDSIQIPPTQDTIFRPQPKSQRDIPTKIFQFLAPTEQIMVDKPKPKIHNDVEQLFKVGVFTKSVTCPCVEYKKTCHSDQMTGYKYKMGVSKRILVAKETLTPQRAKLPVLIIDLDGTIGFFDQSKSFTLRQADLNLMISLSNNYRVVAYCCKEAKNTVLRACRQLKSYQKSFVFDAVYMLQQTSKNRVKPNLTQIFLDFYDEEQPLGKYVSRNVIVLSPDSLKINQKPMSECDLTEFMVIDKDHYKPAKSSPIIVRLMHAQLRTSKMIFEAAFLLCLMLRVLSCDQNQQVSTYFPKQIKNLDKIISNLGLEKLIVYGGKSNVYQGFKQLLLDFEEDKKVEWLSFTTVDFKPPVPIIIQLQSKKSTAHAELLSQVRSSSFQFSSDGVMQRFKQMQKANEKIKKQLISYKALYWQKNQIEQIQQQAVKKKKTKDLRCSDSSDYGSESSSTDSELADYDEQYPEMKFKIIRIKCFDTSEPLKTKAQLIKLDGRIGKPSGQQLIEMLSRRLPPVQYLTTQFEHNVHSQKEQIESSVKELEMRLETTKKSTIRETFNYD